MTNRYPAQDFDVAAAQAQLSDIMQTDNPEDDAMAFALVHGIQQHKIAEELTDAETQLGAIMETDNPEDDAIAFELMRKINHLKPRVA